MTRRKLCLGMLAAGFSTIWQSRAATAATAASIKSVDALQKNWQTLLADGVKVPLPTEPLKLSKEEWRKRLNPEQFHILREEGTEQPGSSPLNNEKRPGIFACAGCGLPLFTSEMKYRKRHRLAKLFHHHPRRLRQDHRLQIDPAAHRIPLHPLRRPSRPCLRRRPQTDRPTLVQQRRGPEVHCQDRQSGDVKSPVDINHEGTKSAKFGIIIIRTFVSFVPSWCKEFFSQGWQRRFRRTV